MSDRVLVGDIGGTNCRFALYEPDGAAASIERTYKSHDFASLTDAIARLVADTGATFARACFAVAGPVRAGVCRATNIPWVVDERALAGGLGGATVKVINDFAAQTMGVASVCDGGDASGEALVALVSGERDPESPIAVLGAGTGLGEAIAARAADRSWVVVPGEGGHADFAATDERQERVLRAMRAALGTRVTYEHVVSGPGLANIFRALVASRDERSPAPSQAVLDAMSREDPSAVITREALSGGDSYCREALEVFIEAYAQEAGNIALRALAYGGVYLAGGIAPKVLSALRDGRFEARFRDKAPHRAVMASMSVSVVVAGDLGLRGARAAIG